MSQRARFWMSRMKKVVVDGSLDCCPSSHGGMWKEGAVVPSWKDRPILERARYGARYLDRVAPDWRKRVVRDRLDQMSDTNNVASQITGLPYLEIQFPKRGTDACDRLGITAENEARLGFAVPIYTCFTVAESRQAYAELTEAWKIVWAEEPTRFKMRTEVG